MLHMETPGGGGWGRPGDHPATENSSNISGGETYGGSVYMYKRLQESA